MKEHINNLIDNYTNTIPLTTECMDIDLILDGGAFSGCYMIGSLLYLKEMERRKIISIKRISGCSIGALLALIYTMDILDIHSIIYTSIKNGLRDGNMKRYIKILKMLGKKLPLDYFKHCNGKIYISFYDMRYKSQRIKSTFKSNNDLIATILKSSFIPYISTGAMLYKNRYFDGMYPYIFSKEPYRKTLFINLCNRYLFKMFDIKNETHDTERIMTGIIDCHSYFFHKRSIHYIIDMYDHTPLSIVQQTAFLMRIICTNISIYCIYIGIGYLKRYGILLYIESILNSNIQKLLQHNSI